MRLAPLLFCSFLLSFLLSPPGRASSSIDLSEQNLVDLYLKNSPAVVAILKNIEAKQASVFEVKKDYTWEIFADASYRITEAEDLFLQHFEREERLSQTLGLKKDFSTGTSVTLQYEKNSMRTQDPVFTTNPFPGTLNQDAASVELRQNLFANFLGRNDRKRILRQELLADLEVLEQVEELEKEILNLLNERTLLMVAKAELEAARSSFAAFERLARVVRQQERVGAALPGESSRAASELESLRQVQWDKEEAIEEHTQNLLSSLGMGFENELEVALLSETLKRTELPEVQAKNLRPVLISQKKGDRARAQMSLARNERLPELNIVGSYELRGQEENSGRAFAEMLGGERPNAYVGVELRYLFGASFNSLRSRNARALASRQRALQSVSLAQIEATLNKLKKSIETSLEKDRSLSKELKLREDTLRKSERNYKRARIPLDTYVQQVDRLFQAKNNWIRNKGRYRLLLHQYSELSDTLVSLDQIAGLEDQ